MPKASKRMTSLSIPAYVGLSAANSHAQSQAA
jgi:hypothetical protein